MRVDMASERIERKVRLVMRRIEGFPLWIGTARDARDIKGVLNAGIEAIVDLAIMNGR